MSEEEESQIQDIWRLKKTDKWKLYQYVYTNSKTSVVDTKQFCFKS